MPPKPAGQQAPPQQQRRRGQPRQHPNMAPNLGGQHPSAQPPPFPSQSPNDPPQIMIRPRPPQPPPPTHSPVRSLQQQQRRRLNPQQQQRNQRDLLQRPPPPPPPPPPHGQGLQPQVHILLKEKCAKHRKSMARARTVVGMTLSSHSIMHGPSFLLLMDQAVLMSINQAPACPRMGAATQPPPPPATPAVQLQAALRAASDTSLAQVGTAQQSQLLDVLLCLPAAWQRSWRVERGAGRGFPAHFVEGASVTCRRHQPSRRDARTDNDPACSIAEHIGQQAGVAALQA